MKIVYDINHKEWDAFVARSADGGLLQTSFWSDFSASTGKKTWRLAIEDGGSIIAGASVVRQNLPFNLSYLYCPRGPIINSSSAADLLLAELLALAAKEHSLFIKFEPTGSFDWREYGFRAAGEVQPKSTLVLDLSKAEEDLLKQMKAKTRYNVKLAQKHGVTISFFSSEVPEKRFEEFWQLMKQTSVRDQISVHGRQYYRKMLALPQMVLVLAYVDGRPAATAILADFGAWSYYLHGGSDYELRDKMAPYLLQWEMIHRAKSRGAKFYDFWGASESKWPGVTRFKKGFAPTVAFTVFAGAIDLPINKAGYFLYRIYKKFR